MEEKVMMCYTSPMSDAWVRDTGLVCVLVALVIEYYDYGSKPAILIAGVLLLVVLFFPSLLRPIARVWLMIAEVFGYLMRPVFFGLIFFIVITPIGVLRRILRGDARNLVRDTLHTTAFVPKNGLVTPDVLERPY